jgi:hypothetical protein
VTVQGGETNEVDLKSIVRAENELHLSRIGSLLLLVDFAKAVSSRHRKLSLSRPNMH